MCLWLLGQEGRHVKIKSEKLTILHIYYIGREKFKFHNRDEFDLRISHDEKKVENPVNPLFLQLLEAS